MPPPQNLLALRLFTGPWNRRALYTRRSFYLTWKAREFGVHTRFVELAGEVNRGMPNYVISKLTDGLNELGLPIKDSSVLVLGVAYKPNVDDVRESPSMKLIKLLSEKGAIVNYSTPSFPICRRCAITISICRVCQ